MQGRIRQPVVVVLGHVDSGKTTLLDKIRGTVVQAREAGGMTQHIGASFFPMNTLREVCGRLLTKVGGEVQIPGLLVIDTPGHEVFANLRTRGGSAADISILVVDILRGFEVQTHESIEILKSRKVPFLIALNKIDFITGWRPSSSPYLTESLKVQDRSVVEKVDEQLYRVMGTLSQLGFSSEAFYRVRDFTKEVAIVPVSAKTGEGIPELLAVLVGLAQQYLKGRLAVTKGEPKGIVLEVKEETGLGHTANVILLDGVLSIGDKIILSKREGAIITRVKAIFMPKPLDEMRDPRDRFTSVQTVVAAAGVKVVTPDLDGVLAGSPMLGLRDLALAEDYKRQVEGEVKGIFISTDRDGVVVKCDTLGSLEALVDILRRRKIPIRVADIGPVTRRDVVEASVVKQSDPYLSAILAFGVKLLPDAEEEVLSKGIKVFTDPVMYNLIQSYLGWVASEKQAAERREFDRVTFPCKLLVLKGFIFRRSDPAIFGVEVLSGRLKPKTMLMSIEGKTIGTIQQIQDKGEKVPEATVGSQVAISVQEPVVGRHFNEGDILYTLPREEDVKLLLSKFKDRLTADETEVLNETIEVKRKTSPLWGFSS